MEDQQTLTYIYVIVFDSGPRLRRHADRAQGFDLNALQMHGRRGKPISIFQRGARARDSDQRARIPLASGPGLRRDANRAQGSDTYALEMHASCLQEQNSAAYANAVDVGPCAPTRIRSNLQSGEITRKWRALKAGKAEKQKTMICIHILACIARAQGSDADTFKPHALTNSKSKSPCVLQYDGRDQDTASFEFPISYGRLGPRAPTSRHSETTRVQLKK